MPSITDLVLTIDEHLGEGGRTPPSPDTHRPVLIPGPNATLRVAFRATNDQDVRWLGRIDVYGKDAAGDQRLFNFRFLEARRVFGRPGQTWTFAFVDDFDVAARSTIQRMDTMSVVREALDEDPAKVVTAKTRNYGELTLEIPDVDEIFARVTLTPSSGSAAPVTADSNTVTGMFEWPGARA